jgi:UDP-N-acetylmuramyl pentapeptide phosphotransferase/UDP-N-acetylglucosamine-1-phosphate transferase
MLYISVIVPFVLAIVLATYIIPRILVVSVKKDLVIPSETKDKGRLRVPRLGGVSLFPILVISVGATIVVLLTFFAPSFLSTEDQTAFVQYMFGLAGLTTMYLLGVMDDLLGVSLTSKFLIQILSASLIPMSGIWLDDLHGLLGIFELPAWIGMPLTVLMVLYITNAIPMLDDVDGLASGLAMIAFTFLGWLAYQGGEPLLMTVCVAMTGMLMPFFFRNVVSGRVGWRNIYLGDTGGLTIGYLLSFVVIGFSRLGGVTLPDGVIMACFGTLVIPLLDVLRVAVTRIINHRNIFLRDNNHIHHRLIQGGMRPMMVLFTILLISFFFVAFNLIGVWSGWNLSLLLVGDVIVWLFIQVVISYFKNKNRDKISNG